MREWRELFFEGFLEVLAGFEVLVSGLVVVGFFFLLLLFGFVPAAQVVAQVLVLEVFVEGEAACAEAEVLHGGVAEVGWVGGDVAVVGDEAVRDVPVGVGDVGGGGFGGKVAVHHVLLVTVVVDRVVVVVGLSGDLGIAIGCFEDLDAVDLLFEVDERVVHVDYGVGCRVVAVVGGLGWFLKGVLLG